MYLIQILVFMLLARFQVVGKVCPWGRGNESQSKCGPFGCLLLTTPPPPAARPHGCGVAQCCCGHGWSGAGAGASHAGAPPHFRCPEALEAQNSPSVGTFGPQPGRHPPPRVGGQCSSGTSGHPHTRIGQNQLVAGQGASHALHASLHTDRQMSPSLEFHFFPLPQAKGAKQRTLTKPENR